MTDMEKAKKLNIYIVLMLALFSFCFLGTEYFFDNAIGKWCDSAGVVFNQNLILGASVLGYLSYWLISEKLKKVNPNYFYVTLIFIDILCLIAMMVKQSYGLTLAAGIVCFVIMGIAGSAVCYYASVKITKPEYLARVVGLSYGLGILIQYVNNNLIPKDYEILTISVCAVLFGVIMLKVYNFSVPEAKETEKNVRMIGLKEVKSPIIALICCVALMTIVFSTLDNMVTLVHASGDFDIGQWPRLILAVSGITAGILYDINKRKSMPAIMYIITILSVIAIIIIKLGGSFVIGLIVFYVSAGFFVIFFMTAFMDISFYTEKPKLFAGLGRAINNLFAIIVTGISVKLLETNSQMIILIVALLLFALISVCMLVYYRAFMVAENAEKLHKALEEFSEKQKEKKDIDKFAEFVSEHKLTPRESDVLRELISDGEVVTEISKKLAISRATLYRHIAKINEKTSTDSRMALVQYYHKWNP